MAGARPRDLPRRHVPAERVGEATIIEKSAQTRAAVRRASSLTPAARTSSASSGVTSSGVRASFSMKPSVAAARAGAAQCASRRRPPARRRHRGRTTQLRVELVQNGHWWSSEVNAANSSRSPGLQSDGPRIARSSSSEYGARRTRGGSRASSRRRAARRRSARGSPAAPPPGRARARGRRRRASTDRPLGAVEPSQPLGDRGGDGLLEDRVVRDAGVLERLDVGVGDRETRSRAPSRGSSPAPAAASRLPRPRRGARRCARSRA